MNLAFVLICHSFAFHIEYLEADAILCVLQFHVFAVKHQRAGDLDGLWVL